MLQFDQEKPIGNLYKITTKLGSGSFGEVFKGVNMETNEIVAIKLESQEAQMPQIKHEFQILSAIQGNGIPKVHWFGQWEDKTVMVMELLGYNLEQLFNLVNRRFELKTMLMLIDQMIDIISLLHSKGYIYRDIKPENFLMGINKKYNTIYIIDFGLSKKYKDKKTGEHILYKENKGLVGTARYVSLNTHLGIEQSRRDDMESLGYLWLYFLKGSLPWQGLNVNNREEKYELIKTIKQTISVEDLCHGLPHEFVKYFQHCRQLKFEEEPDYKRFKMLFRDLFFKLDFVWDYQFNWIDSLEQEQIQSIMHSRNSKNSLSSHKGESYNLKTEEEDEIIEKIEFKIGGDIQANQKNVKPIINIDKLISKPNLFESIFK
ncbi:unnamed protein product (macronuclear) [Paramecium tetraurelia]|uniref:Casein kinase I n=1 Tax=Paramecium tetraurelia TaxID=5888 RepID=A0D4D1_PARTE|nr:uncharacterized protein GSPATT00013364001 [Paramecium tetraurelia]CAK77898.1 unnamed protein product [Paramecium tetraurelia]|eukprot:XP_001445295.1 hypothetical protein (macronuclear) [Paramecium tetraurelia strain d4-2]